MVVEAIVEAAPAQGGTGLAALGGVVVDHIHQHFEALLVAGLDQGPHLVANLEGIAALLVAVVGGHPAERAVAPVVLAAVGGVVGIEGHHRQQLHRGDAQVAQVGQGLDQAQVGALALRANRRTSPAAEAAEVQFVNDAALPAVAGPGKIVEVEAIPFGHHPLEAGGRIRGRPHPILPAVDLPARDRPGAGIEQHLGGIEAVATGLQRAKHPVGVATAEADAPHLHVPVVTGAMQLGIEGDHLDRFRCLAIGEQQQLDPGRQGRHHRKVDAGGGGGGP